MSRDEFIHRWVPPADPTERRTVLLLHGTGGNESSLLQIGAALIPGAALLSPRGRVLEGTMPRYFRRLAEGVFDLDDLARRTDELGRFLDESAERYGFDRGKVVAAGISNGANIGASLLLRGVRLRQAVLWRAMLPFDPPAPPDLTGTDVLLGSGREDPLVPRDQPEQLAGVLRAAGARVSLDWRDAGHQLTPFEVDEAAAWIRAGAAGR
jgi:phospholipase/carboxylesterase